MGQFVDGLREALDLIGSGDPLVREIALRTLRVGFEATLIAVLLGVPLGTLLALRPFRGRGVAVVLVNAGIRLPPIALGQILWLVMWPDSRWGGGPLARPGVDLHARGRDPRPDAARAADRDRADRRRRAARAGRAARPGRGVRRARVAARRARRARGAARRDGRDDRRARHRDRVGRRGGRDRELARERDARDGDADVVERRLQRRARGRATGPSCSPCSWCSPPR